MACHFEFVLFAILLGARLLIVGADIGENDRASGQEGFEEESELRRALASNPTDSKRVFALGRYLANLRGSQQSTAQAEASHLLQHAVELDPQNATFWYGSALLATRERRLEEADSFFKVSLELDPANGLAALRYGRHLKKTQSAAVAFDQFASASLLLPDNFQAQAALAGAHHSRGRKGLAEATHLYAFAVQLQPKDFEVHHDLGLVFGAQERHAEAAQQFIDGAAIAPMRAKVHLNLGVALVAERSFNSALKAFAASVTLEPANADASEELARTLWRVGRPVEAGNMAMAAIALQPTRSSAAESLANAMVSQHRFPEAVDWLRHTISLSPQSSQGASKLGQILFAQGLHNEAAVALRKATEDSSARNFDHPILWGLTLEFQGHQELACQAYNTGISRASPALMEQVRSLALAKSECQTQHAAHPNTSPVMMPCARGDMDCWDVEQRRVAATWQKDNLCLEPGDSVLAENCGVFNLRRSLLHGWLNHCQVALKRQPHARASTRYAWEQCLPCAGHQMFTEAKGKLDLPRLSDLTFQQPVFGNDVGHSDGSDFSAAIAKWGVVRLLPSDQMRALTEAASANIVESLFTRAALIDGRTSQYVHQAQNRHHLRIAPNETSEIAEIIPKLAFVAESILPSEAADGLVAELGAFITNPGAEAQRWHADLRHPGCEYCSSACAGASDCGNENCTTCLSMHANAPTGKDLAPAYSCQLFLTAEEGMSSGGGLEVIPGTHEIGTYFNLNASNAKNYGISMAGPPGTIACYDGSALHRAAAFPVRESKSRVVLYLSVLGRGTIALAGSAFAPHLVGLRLSDLISRVPLPNGNACTTQDTSSDELRSGEL